MTTEIRPIYPLQGSESVSPTSSIVFDIVNLEDGLAYPWDLYVRARFDKLPNEAYAGSIDPFNTGLVPDALNNMNSVDTDSRGFDMVHERTSGFQLNASALSSITEIIPLKHIRVSVIFDKDIEFGLLLQMEVSVLDALATVRTQQFSFRYLDRPYYSPALGDGISNFESLLLSLSMSDLPAVEKLKNHLLPAIHGNDTVAARRFLEILLANKLRFSDLSTEVQQILAGYRTKDFKPVFNPTKYFDIATSIGIIGINFIDAAAKELGSNKAIARELIAPILEILPAASANKTYRTAAAIALVAVGVKFLGGI